MEMIAFLGDRANIEYKMGTDKKPKDKISDSKLQLALHKMKEAEGNKEELPVKEMPEPVEEPVPSGLMARRT